MRELLNLKRLRYKSSKNPNLEYVRYDVTIPMDVIQKYGLEKAQGIIVDNIVGVDESGEEIE